MFILVFGFVLEEGVKCLTIRIRRRREQDVADTTESLRAVACIRFVRRCGSG